MLNLLICAMLSQNPGYTSAEMTFWRDGIGRVWGKGPSDAGWLPVRGELPPESRIVTSQTPPKGPINQATTVGTQDGTGGGRMRGTGDGTGGGKVVKPASAPKGTTAVASPAKLTTIEATIKKLAAVPNPPNTANGGRERWDYTNKQMAALEDRVADLQNELASLREAMQGIVKILEARSSQ